MTIHFADPGYDWTIFIVLMSILGVILLAAGIFETIYVRRKYRSNAGNIAFALSMVALVYGLLGCGMGIGIGGDGVYDDRVNAALYSELAEAGFDQISMEWDEIDGKDVRILTGLLDGEEFKGTIENLHYPKDYTYKITELEDTK